MAVLKYLDLGGRLCCAAQKSRCPIETPMVQDRSTKIIPMIQWTRTSRLSIMKSLCGVGGAARHRRVARAHAQTRGDADQPAAPAGGYPEPRHRKPYLYPHPTPFTLQPAPNTLHPTPHTLHPTPYTQKPNTLAQTA